MNDKYKEYKELAEAIISVDIMGTCPCKWAALCEGKDCIVAEAKEIISIVEKLRRY